MYMYVYKIAHIHMHACICALIKAHKMKQNYYFDSQLEIISENKQAK